MFQLRVSAFVWLLFSACATAGPAPAQTLQTTRVPPPLAAKQFAAPVQVEASVPAEAQPTAAVLELCEAGPPEACQQPSAAVSEPTETPFDPNAREDDRYVDVVSDLGQRAHGLYFTALMARRLGASGIIHAVRSAGMNAAVIDIKDQDGRVSFDTHVAALAPERQLLIGDMPGLLRELKSASIYTIARIACFSDQLLPRVRPDLAVMDSRPGRAGEIWNQRKSNTWLDPYNTKNHDIIIELAVEAESLGFDEVQLDYIRFPVDAGTVNARFPSQSDQPRHVVMLGLLRRIDEALHIPLGVDVFGMTTIRTGDPEGLGQSLDEWAQYVEVFSPMLYVNGMKPWLRKHTEGRAGLLVEISVHALRERVGPSPVIRPFLQAFEHGADYFNTAFIAEQIRGARLGGGDGFLFWNPASRYGVVREHMNTGGRAEVPFEIGERGSARMHRWGQSESATEVTLTKPTRDANFSSAAISGDDAHRLR